MTRRHATIAAGGVLVVAGALAAGVLVTGGGDDARATDAGATTQTKIATVTRRDLVETDSEDGTLGYSDTRTVVNRLSGTVTWLPLVGTVVHAGQRVYAVDGSPVYLMDGSAPAYRALTPATGDGADVRQLERNLRVLGYDPGEAMTVDGSWDAGTTAAVERFQAAKGLDETGSLPLGRVVFQPGPRRIASIDVTLGASAASGSGQAATSGGGGVAGVVGGLAAGLAHALQTGVTTTAPATTTATTTTPAPTPTVTQTVTVTTPAPRTPAATTRAPRTTAAAGPTAALRSAGGGGGPAAGGASASAAGTSSGSGAASSPLLTTTSTRQIVTVQLDAAKQDVARTGARVAVELPSGGVVHGRVTRVGTVATAASSNQSDQGGASATLKVTIKLFRRVAALDQAPVTVDFEQSRARDVLAIPVTALLARPGGRFGVEVRDGAARRVVPVTTGLYTSGYVEIRGAVRPGQRITNSGI